MSMQFKWKCCPHWARHDVRSLSLLRLSRQIEQSPSMIISARSSNSSPSLPSSLDSGEMGVVTYSSVEPWSNSLLMSSPVSRLGACDLTKCCVRVKRRSSWHSCSSASTLATMEARSEVSCSVCVMGAGGVAWGEVSTPLRVMRASEVACSSRLAFSVC